jgi:hypothetical protein
MWEAEIRKMAIWGQSGKEKVNEIPQQTSWVWWHVSVIPAMVGGTDRWIVVQGQPWAKM